MSEPKRVIILIRPGRDGQHEISVLDPITNRESRTGLKAGPPYSAVEEKVKSLKTTLERAGNRVEVKTVS